MFDELLEKIKRIDEIENKLRSIFEGKTREQISLLRHLATRSIKEAELGEKEQLTSKQEEVLKKFEPGEEYSAYTLRTSLGTLNALARKGYLTSKSGLGSMAFPRSSVMFKLSENLTSHARRELELAGMFDEEVDGSEAMGSWNRLCAEAVLELMEVFAEQGHSGFSANMTQELFSRLARYEKLTELTDNIDEWMNVHEYCSDGPDMWQSTRSPSCFSEDGGKTYWDIDEDWNKHEDEDGSVWTGGGSIEEWDNRPMHQSKHIEKKE